MNLRKSILSALLAVTMLTSTTSVIASAAATSTSVKTYAYQMELNTSKVLKNKLVEKGNVSVSYSNKGVCSISIPADGKLRIKTKGNGTTTITVYAKDTKEVIGKYRVSVNDNLFTYLEGFEMEDCDYTYSGSLSLNGEVLGKATGYLYNEGAMSGSITAMGSKMLSFKFIDNVLYADTDLPEELDPSVAAINEMGWLALPIDTTGVAVQSFPVEELLKVAEPSDFITTSSYYALKLSATDLREAAELVDQTTDYTIPDDTKVTIKATPTSTGVKFAASVSADSQTIKLSLSLKEQTKDYKPTAPKTYTELTGLM